MLFWRVIKHNIFERSKMILFTFLFVVENSVCRQKKTFPHRIHVKVALWFVAKAVTCKAMVVFSISTFLWQTLAGRLTKTSHPSLFSKPTASNLLGVFPLARASNRHPWEGERWLVKASHHNSSPLPVTDLVWTCLAPLATERKGKNEFGDQAGA